MVTKKQFIRRWEMRMAEESKCPPHMRTEFLQWFRTTVYYRRELLKLEIAFAWQELRLAVKGAFRRKR